MPKYYKKVSVVIPTYNRKEKLMRLIKSLFNSKYKNLEIVVVDGNSNMVVLGAGSILQDSELKNESKKLNMLHILSLSVEQFI